MAFIPDDIPQSWGLLFTKYLHPKATLNINSKDAVL